MKKLSPLLLQQKPDWLPNWKDAENYNFSDDKCKKLFSDVNYKEVVAWQFLRRNQEYNSFFSARKREYLELAKDSISKNDLALNGQHIHFKYSKRTETNVDIQYSSIPIDWLLDPAIKEELEKWGLEYYVDPSHLKPTCLNFRSSNPISVNIINKDIILKSEIPYGYATVLINLKKSISPQLRSAELGLENYSSLIEEEKDSQNYFREGKKYSIYLRIIDALVSGEAPKIIKKILYVNVSDLDDQFKKDRKAAINMVNEGYKDLLIRY